MSGGQAVPPGLVRDWRYQKGSVGPRAMLSRLWRGAVNRQSGPKWQCVRPITPADRWIGYFIFLPNGELSDHHRYTLERLRNHDARLAVICAAPSILALPPELGKLTDALYWKDLSGFDFSAYAILTGETARRSTGADLIVLNDSVLGPFADLYSVFDRGAWAMTGLTGYSLIENHIQSYAFRFRAANEDIALQMAEVAGDRLAFDSFMDVIYCQETRFAKTMARQCDVGALWFSDHRAGGGDLPLTWPLGLIGEGFPFLKRSLFTKFKGMTDGPALRAFLLQSGHPLP